MKKLKEILKNIPVQDIISKDIELTKSGDRYYRGICHDSLVVDIEKNLFFWNSLGIYGTALDWLLKIKGMSYYESMTILQEQSGIPLRQSLDMLYRPTYPYPKLLGIFHELGKRHRAYWKSRGYTDDTIDLFQLGFTGRHYVIPILYKGELRNFQCRTPDKRIWNWTRGVGPQPFNFDILSEISWVIITESPVDAILATQYGFPAISQTGGSGTWNKEWNSALSHLKTIYLIYDNDKAGIRGMKSVGKKSFPSKCFVVNWKDKPEKYDLGDLLLEASIPHVELSRLLDRCLPYESLGSPYARELYEKLWRSK